MDKKTVIIVVVVAVALVAGLLILNSPKAPTNTEQSIVIVPDTVPGAMPGSMTIKVEKIQGQQIFFLSTANKEMSVTVGSDTKIVKQVNTNGLFKDVAIKLSDLKAGQILEITTDASGTIAKTIRVLQ